MIGVDLVRAITGGLQIFKFYDSEKLTGISLGQLWKHCLCVAFAARRLAEVEGLPPRMCADAFTIGLLHDVGKLILATNAPEEFRQAWDAAERENKPLHEIEADIFGSTHAQIGAYLLRLWGLPDSIVTAVEMHHSISKADYKMFSPFFMVHMAQCVTRPARSLPPWHQQFTAELGLTEKVQAWRDMLGDPVPNSAP
jgi:putative nucleotidyltransferase with HDIG domain